MIYTPLTRKAIQIAYAAHEGQLDKSGLPYIFHPWHLAESMTDEAGTVAALLHDVAEDTDVTLPDLAKQGFPPEVMEALRLLTHDKAVPYMDYIRALAHDPIARRVKLADLAHNSDTSRLDALPPGAEQKLALYREATAYLSALQEAAAQKDEAEAKAP